MIKGIGSHLKGKLLRAFGEQVCNGISHEPACLLALEGSSSERKEQVTRAWTVKKVVHEIMVFLQTHGVGAAGAVRIYKTYVEQAFLRIRGSGYRLALEIHGIELEQQITTTMFDRQPI